MKGGRAVARLRTEVVTVVHWEVHSVCTVGECTGWAPASIEGYVYELSRSPAFSIEIADHIRNNC